MTFTVTRYLRVTRARIIPRVMRRGGEAGEVVGAVDVATKRFAEYLKAVRLVTRSSTLERDFEKKLNSKYCSMHRHKAYNSSWFTKVFWFSS